MLPINFSPREKKEASVSKDMDSQHCLPQPSALQSKPGLHWESEV